MKSYHGTSRASASIVAGNGVKVSLGGGELGRGFYTGEHLHEAKAWAYHSGGDCQRNVVCFDVPDAEIDALDFLLFDHPQAGLRRHQIKHANGTRTYLFFVDMVWAPIVGSAKASGDQFKWESSQAEALLNSPKVPKSVI